jgi:hypothetical protein
MSGIERDASCGSLPPGRDASPDEQPPGASETVGPLPPHFEDDLIDLIDTAEKLASNPVAAWEAIRVEVERRIAQWQEWAPSGKGGVTQGGVEHDRSGQRTGGAKLNHPGAKTQARRQFSGFDLEVATYARLKPELLARNPGSFVVIVGDEVEGPVDTFREALRAGYRRFGLGPLFVKQLLTIEPSVEVTRDIMPCRS